MADDGDGHAGGQGAGEVAGEGIADVEDLRRVEAEGPGEVLEGLGRGLEEAGVLGGEGELEVAGEAQELELPRRGKSERAASRRPADLRLSRAGTRPLKSRTLEKLDSSSP